MLFFFFLVFFFDILHRKTTFSEVVRRFSLRGISDVASELQSSDVTFNVACDIKNYYLSYIISLIFDNLRRITTFSGHSTFFVAEHK